MSTVGTRLALGQPPRKPDSNLWLDFGNAAVGGTLSAVEAGDGRLYTAGDEDTVLHRLSIGEDGVCRHDQAIDLAHPFDLPDHADSEIDTEGLCRDGQHLWIAGSHSRTRRKPQPKKGPLLPPEAAFARMGEVNEPAPNRYLLGFLNLAGEGRDPEAPFHRKDAAALAFTRRGNTLVDAMTGDPHLESFLALPGKENGFNIEGIAAKDMAVFLGLRGPVLSGFALLLELDLDRDKQKLRLKKRADKPPYLKHAIDLWGLGIRDLAFRDEHRLLMLAGPTMKLDGPSMIFEWEIGQRPKSGGLVEKDGPRYLFSLPEGQGYDHAEGIAVLSSDQLLVVYDSPAPDRANDSRGYRADVFRLSA